MGNEINGPGNGIDAAYAISLDDSGNVYVTGGSDSSETLTDYATIKYNNSGIEQWVARYNGPRNELDFAQDITTDNLGNVYITGYSEGSGNNYDYTTIKYAQPADQRNSEIVSIDIPSDMIANQTYQGYIDVKNTGWEIWTSEGSNPFRLGAEGDSDELTNVTQWRIDLDPGEEIAYGETKRFYITFTPHFEDIQNSPITTEWRMLKEYVEWFGETASQIVTVVPANDTDYISDSIPDIVFVGEENQLSIEFKNVGVYTWTSTEMYRLGISGDITQLGCPGRVELSGDISPMDSATFNFTIVPTRLGTFNISLRMLKEYVEWFGDEVDREIKVVDRTGVNSCIFELYE